MRKINVRSPYYIEVAPRPDMFYALQKCSDDSLGYISEQEIGDIELENGDRVEDSLSEVYIVVGTSETGTSVGLVTDTGETGCPIPPPPLYYSLKKCSDDTLGYRTEQETTEITLLTNARVQDSGNNNYVVLGQTETGTSVGIVTDTGEADCPVIVSPIAPQTIDVNCGDTHNVATDVGVVTYRVNTAETGTFSVDITGSDVPAKFTLKWDGNESTTNYIGLDLYDQDLLDAGVPQGEIATSDPSTKISNSVSINKTASSPELVELVVNAPLPNDEYSVVFNCPVSPPVVIEETTQINIWFDDSGSMDSTLAPLQDMVAGNLKSCLVGFYNGSSTEYDKYVQVINMGRPSNPFHERTFFYSANVPTVPGATNVINIIFQDEAQTGYHDSSVYYNPNTAPTTLYNTDISILKTNLNNNPTGYITPIIFQVDGYNGFKEFLKAVENNEGSYAVAGLKDYPNVKFYYDVQDGVSYASDPTYYRNLIIQAINDLGFSLTCP